MAILISEKVSFEIKIISKGREHFTKIIRSIHHEDITIINMYVPNNRCSKYKKQKGQNKEETAPQ